ncbi:MAG: ribonuclease III [Lachnospiraceae bacterium]|nr:ribonuclease III [Lachnospiraceae bacterium]
MAQSISIFDNIKDQFALKDKDPNQYSPLSLAFIGDSVFDLVVKTVVVELANCPARILHKKTTEVVKAESQAKIVDEIYSSLSEEEQNIYRRGRNAKPYTKAKNVNFATYCKATGLEALIGYLYLKGRTERLVSIVKEGIVLLDCEWMKKT